MLLNGKLEVHDSRSCGCHAELCCRNYVSAGLLSSMCDEFPCNGLLERMRRRELLKDFDG